LWQHNERKVQKSKVLNKLNLVLPVPAEAFIESLGGIKETVSEGIAGRATQGVSQLHHTAALKKSASTQHMVHI